MCVCRCEILLHVSHSSDVSQTTRMFLSFAFHNHSYFVNTMGAHRLFHFHLRSTTPAPIIIWPRNVQSSQKLAINCSLRLRAASGFGRATPCKHVSIALISLAFALQFVHRVVPIARHLLRVCRNFD